MSRFKTMPRMLLVVVAALQLTACSKTVQWEEEVPLNTGETIWVKRSGTYTYKSAPGNPLDFGYGPERRSTIEFDYKGKQYAYTSEAGPILLVISPTGQPNLIALADDAEWGNRNKYPCDAPYYVQFRPSENGSEWTWPNRIDAWLHNLPTNLIFGLVPLESNGKRVSAADREQKNASITTAFIFYKIIDPNYSSQYCVRSN